MSNFPNTWQEELLHFQECKNIIKENLSKYQQEYNSRHEEVQQLHRAIKEEDPELYNQLMTAASLEEQAALALEKNQAALNKPYFGRIDYLDESLAKKQQVYIGKHGIFQDKTTVLIADWRAPISSVYYENELGHGEYGLPDEKPFPITLELKRTYDISEGQLLGYYDSDIAASDELLIQYLSRNKDVVLGEIIAIIQKEQNTIIRESPFANLIVQGVAGSGKTTVAMHRISYLLYNYKERFAPNEFCIIGSNDLLLNYITSGLPELDVPNIKHLRMDQLFIRLCEKDWTPKTQIISQDNTAKYRCTLAFMEALEDFLEKKRREIITCATLKDSKFGIILSKSNNQTLLAEHPEFSIARLLSTLDDRVKSRLQFLLAGYDRDKTAAILKRYSGFYKRKLPKTSIFQLYQDFLLQWRENLRETLVNPGDIIEDITNHIVACSKYQYDLYDLAALALIHYRVTQKAPNEEFGLLFLDEAQDFGVSIFYALKTLLPHTYFTIMGDVSQNINYDTGINDWEQLTSFFLDDPKDKFLMLCKSYRNTIEISEYAGKLLESASSGRYKITPVIRHGLPVIEEGFWSDMEIAERIISLLPSIQERGYTTTAIICMSDEECVQAYSLLKGSIDLVNGKDTQFTRGTFLLPISMVKGLEFDAVILWNPRIRQNMTAPDKAKLLYVAATRALHELYVFEC